MKQFETLLTAAGLPAEKVAELSAIPADQWEAFKPDDYVGLLRSGAETALKNDPKFWEGLDESNVNEGFKKKIEASQFGRAAGIAKQKVLKAFGMTEADLADLTAEEQAKYEIVISKAAEKYASSKVSDKQLQQDLLNERKKFEELTASLPEKETAYKTKLEGEYFDKTLGLLTLGDLSKVEGLKSPVKYVLPTVLAELKETYDFEVKGFDIKPLQKGTKLSVIEGSKELSLTDLIDRIITRDKLAEPKVIKKEPIIGSVIIEPKDGKLGVSSHIAAAINANMPTGK
jgi:hypothetical protein